ncbi:MAG: thioredoxin domain-containing protein, partial [Nitrospirota bacterium]
MPWALLEGEIGETLLDEAVENILSQFDPQNGGFGRSPKFPMPGSIEFLINRFFFTRKESIGFAIKKTLDSMAKGGFHDQIGGGFHRYSVDEAWIVPHFEKMADDNAWLLRNYIDAYWLFRLDYFKEVAKGIIKFIGNVLSDPEGGFYASQDA